MALAAALVFSAAAAALVPSAARAEGALSINAGSPGGSGASASAALQFRVVIPAVMRVLENSHPSQLETAADGALVGQQRLVVVSNMRHGFCVALRRNQAGAGPWQLETAANNGAALTPTADGYRLCTSRPGRYSLLLQHRFEPTATLTALAWPVQTDITAL